MKKNPKSPGSTKKPGKKISVRDQKRIRGGGGGPWGGRKPKNETLPKD